MKKILHTDTDAHANDTEIGQNRSRNPIWWSFTFKNRSLRTLVYTQILTYRISSDRSRGLTANTIELMVLIQAESLTQARGLH